MNNLPSGEFSYKLISKMRPKPMSFLQFVDRKNDSALKHRKKAVSYNNEVNISLGP